jgi:hypothetical protein
MKRRFVLLILLLASSCRTRATPPLSVADTPDRPPSNADVLACLRGKLLLVGQPRNSPIAIDLAGIEALSIAHISCPIRENVWSTDLSIIYNTGRARYTVEAMVKHSTVDGQHACSSVTIRSVTPR